MEKRYPLLLFIMIFIFGVINAQEEKLLVNENFQTWDVLNSSTTPTIVNKKTSFSNEDFHYTLSEIQVAPSGTNTKFGDIVTPGYLMCAKTATPYIELSPLASITRVEFIHAATGSGRGYILWKKVGSGDWTVVSNAAANPAAGVLVAVNINEKNVALKFTNLNSSQNGYLTDLKIYGDYSSDKEQVSLTTSLSTSGAGVITRSINSETYDAGTEITLTAAANFGYKFKEWTNKSGQTLSANKALTLTLNSDTEIVAVFESITTYNLNLTIAGSKWGEISLSPLPTNGKYEAGTSVTMTIVSNPVTTFSYWDNGENATSRIITIDADKNITATFDEIPFIVGWNFNATEPRTGRSAEYYSESTNIGMMSMYGSNGVAVNWLANAGRFNPAYPCIIKWTGEADFPAEERYFEATFSTKGYKNINLKSLLGGNYRVYSKQKMQYSTNGTTFTDLTVVDLTSVFNSGWVDCNATLPSDAEDKDKIYIRWTADKTSTLLGTSGNDGTSLTNIYVYADKEIVNDSEAPVLVSCIPAEGSNTASTNGSIVLTFNERVQSNGTDITLNGTPLTSVFGSKTASLQYSNLEYNTQYTLVVPQGAIKDMSGNLYGGTTVTFTTMNRQQPALKTFDFIVAQDGSGDGTTIQSAFNAAPVSGSRFIVFVKNGTYSERPSLAASKCPVSLIGESVDNVIITAAVYSGLNGASTSTSQTVEILANDFYAENITIENAAGVDAGQAVALKDYGLYNTYKNVRLLGNQDTHLTGNSSIQYYKSCDIRGTVDFIFGGGDIFFDNCLLYCRQRSGGDVVVAPSTLSSTQYGYVFRDCTIDGDATTQNNKYSLGRPWQNAPRTVYINTRMNIQPAAAGWSDMGVVPQIFAEYNSTNANGESVDLSNRKNSYKNSTTGETTSGLQTVLTDAEASNYTVENVLKGTRNWNPKLLTEETQSPVLSVASNVLTWDAVNYAISYILYKNGVATVFTKETQYTIPQNLRNSAANDNWTIKAISENGSLSQVSNSVSPSNTTGIDSNSNDSDIIYKVIGDYLYLDNISLNSAVVLYNFTGQVLSNGIAKQTNLVIPVSENCIVKIKSNGSIKTIKILK